LLNCCGPPLAASLRIKGVTGVLVEGNIIVADARFSDFWPVLVTENSGPGSTGITLRLNTLSAGTILVGVDAASLPGFKSERNVYWRTTAGPVASLGRTEYTLEELASSPFDSEP